MKESDLIKPNWTRSALDKGKYYAPELTSLGERLYEKGQQTNFSTFYVEREVKYRGWKITFQKTLRSDYTVGDMIDIEITPVWWKKIIQFIRDLKARLLQ